MLPLKKLTIAFLLILGMSHTTSWAATARDKNSGQQMYPGASMDCLITNDFYAVHFTALQHGRQDKETTDFVKYCQEIPGTGKTYLTIDLLDRDARTQELGLRIVEEEYSEDGKSYKTLTTLREAASRIYKNGVADIHADLDHPGHYALMVTFGDEAQATEDDRLRIPFSVGLPSPNAPQQGMKTVAVLSVIGFFAALAVAGYRALRPDESGNRRRINLTSLLHRQT